MKLDPHHPYSSTNKGRTRNHQYGLIERGDDKLATLVTTRPWLVNMMDISPITRHSKSWDIKPEEVGRLYEPHFKRYRSTLPGGRRPSVRSYLDPQQNFFVAIKIKGKKMFQALMGVLMITSRLDWEGRCLNDRFSEYHSYSDTDGLRWLDRNPQLLPLCPKCRGGTWEEDDHPDERPSGGGHTRQARPAQAGLDEADGDIQPYQDAGFVLVDKEWDDRRYVHSSVTD